MARKKKSLAQYKTSLISKYQRYKTHSDHVQALPVSALYLRNTKRMFVNKTVDKSAKESFIPPVFWLELAHQSQERDLLPRQGYVIHQINYFQILNSISGGCQVNPRDFQHCCRMLTRLLVEFMWVTVLLNLTEKKSTAEKPTWCLLQHLHLREPGSCPLLTERAARLFLPKRIRSTRSMASSLTVSAVLGAIASTSYTTV